MDPTLPFPGAFEPQPNGSEGGALRPLDWSALMARFAAERELRRELARALVVARPVADFAGGAALTSGGSSHDLVSHARGVNPDALANLKSTGGITGAAGVPTPATTYDARGQQ